LSKLDQVVFATEKLLSPAAPGVLALVGSYEPDMDALREAVDVDPMLTVRVINEANKSYYASKVPVQSVRRALLRLGWKDSRELLTRLLIQTAGAQLPRQASGVVWHHATRVAHLARLIARSGGAVNPELAYTAGLTHSLGTLGLLALHKEGYGAAVTNARSNVHLAAQERKAFGYDHAAVGSGVLSRMEVPAALADAVNWQYQARVAKSDWNDGGSLALAGTLQLCHWAFAKGDDDVLPTGEQFMAQPLAGRLGLSADTADELGERFVALVADAEAKAA
jgi:HD-like signal output (HDOD) protein